MGAANTRPHELAWNMGTTARQHDEADSGRLSACAGGWGSKVLAAIKESSGRKHRVASREAGYCNGASGRGASITHMGMIT
jgi:hypothetical protein